MVNIFLKQIDLLEDTKEVSELELMIYFKHEVRVETEFCRRYHCSETDQPLKFVLLTARKNGAQNCSVYYYYYY